MTNVTYELVFYIENERFILEKVMDGVYIHKVNTSTIKNYKRDIYAISLFCKYDDSPRRFALIPHRNDFLIFSRYGDVYFNNNDVNNEILKYIKNNKIFDIVNITQENLLLMENLIKDFLNKKCDKCNKKISKNFH